MRWLAISAFVGALSLRAAVAQEQPAATNAAGNPIPPPLPKAVHTPSQIYPIRAEPATGANLPLIRRDVEPPSAADIGPVLKHFVRASLPDNLAQTGTFDNKSLEQTEKVALDRRISVPLVHDVQNDGPGTGPDNVALQYEITYLNWGAVTGQQVLARRGHYFTITWKNSGPRDDFTARFEYRQVHSQEVVRSLSEFMPHVKGGVRSYFAVTSKAYLAYGPIVSWRFTILKGDTIVAQAKSFIW
ncbi:MAG: hypothetical protein WDO13_10835 [Verrucomicrobiota bacterium]